MLGNFNNIKLKRIVNFYIKNKYQFNNFSTKKLIENLEYQLKTYKNKKTFKTKANTQFNFILKTQLEKLTPLIQSKNESYLFLKKKEIYKLSKNLMVLKKLTEKEKFPNKILNSNKFHFQTINEFYRLKKKYKELPKTKKFPKFCFRFLPKNTIFTLVSPENKILTAASTSAAGFKNSKQKTYFACRQGVYFMGQKAQDLGLKKLIVESKGKARGRRFTTNILKKFKIKIIGVKNKASSAHNGCRPSKVRRL